MSDLDDLIASRDQLLDWVALVGPVFHQLQRDILKIETSVDEHPGARFHGGPFSECPTEPCPSAHAAMTEAYRVMEAAT